MPLSINGVGTSVVGSRGDIGWGSFDAMEWFVVFYMPIVPYKAIHTFEWNGEQYRAIPIRWNWELTLRTFFGNWIWGIGILGIIVGFVGVAEWSKPRGMPMLLLGLAMVGIATLGWMLLRITDERNKNIRRVLGGLTIGTCDPVHMQPKLLEEMAGNPQTMYKQRSFGDAVEPLLDQGRFAQAMWAARLCTVLEDRQEGERLTDLVLADPEVREAIKDVREKADRWARVMLTKEERLQLDFRAPGTENLAGEPVERVPAPKRGRKRQEDEQDET